MNSLFVIILDSSEDYDITTIYRFRNMRSSTKCSITEQKGSILCSRGYHNFKLYRCIQYWPMLYLYILYIITYVKCSKLRFFSIYYDKIPIYLTL